MRSTLIAAAVLCLALPGCGDAGKSASGKSSGTASSSRSSRPAPDRGPFKVGMVLDVGGRGDHSINDSAIQGLEKAKDDFDVEIEIAEPKTPGERETVLRALAAKDLDLLFAVGFAFTDAVNRISSEFPDRRFVAVDYTVPEKHASRDDLGGGPKLLEVPFNVRALLFREEEGCFLAGALAGWSTRTGRIGFVAAMPSPAQRRLEKAFTAGVSHANPRAEVGPKYVGQAPDAFRDPAAAKSLALALYDAGADIVMHAAGPSGDGVFEAARERKRFVIGSDTDQSEMAPGLVLTSVVKHVDRGVYETVRATREGGFKGGVSRMGLTTGGIELVFPESEDGGKDGGPVAAGSLTRLESLRRAILSKQVSIPTGDERRQADLSR